MNAITEYFLTSSYQYMYFFQKGRKHNSYNPATRRDKCFNFRFSVWMRLLNNNIQWKIVRRNYITILFNQDFEIQIYFLSCLRRSWWAFLSISLVLNCHIKSEEIIVPTNKISHCFYYTFPHLWQFSVPQYQQFSHIKGNTTVVS